MSDANPYSSPVSSTQKMFVDPELEPKDQKKAEAVIKDAGQFWLAIILCLLCTGIAGFIVPIWYAVRLFQWNKLSTKYPELTVADAPKGSFPAKFNSSLWKLIVGLAFGTITMFLAVVYFVALSTGVLRLN